MKQTRYIFSTIIITLLTFGAVVYTSCKKDRCKELTCQNGSACDNGFCICPSGYSGKFCEIANVTAIVYRNNTFTPLLITVGSTTKTVSAGKTTTFYGSYRDTLRATASTQGNFGQRVTWNDLNRAFPVRDTVNVDVNLPGKFFYLLVTNNTGEPLRDVYVNYGFPEQSLDVLPIPVNVTYGIGYYKKRYNSNVRLEADTTFNFWKFDTLMLDTTKVNEKFQAIAN
ncbi:MAG: EB domain-containing protein [Bacteroidota bacterium]